MIDTHIFVDLMLGKPLRFVGEYRHDNVGVSAVTAAELGCLQRLGRLGLRAPRILVHHLRERAGLELHRRDAQFLAYGTVNRLAVGDCRYLVANSFLAQLGLQPVRRFANFNTIEAEFYPIPQFHLTH